MCSPERSWLPTPLPAMPGLMSSTRWVRPVSPSVDQSSTSPAPLSAANRVMGLAVAPSKSTGGRYGWACWSSWSTLPKPWPALPERRAGRAVRSVSLTEHKIAAVQRRDRHGLQDDGIVTVENYGCVIADLRHHPLQLGEIRNVVAVERND